METEEIIKYALKNHQNITGLRSYMVYDNTMIQDVSGKDYFCKCLKSSNEALRKCEECTEETYEDTRKINHGCVYSCHAGLTRQAVPVQRGDFHCTVISEDVLAMKQMGDVDKWAKYLSRKYQPDESMLLKNFKVIQTTGEGQMNTSIELLEDLLFYHFAMAEKQA